MRYLVAPVPYSKLALGRRNVFAWSENKRFDRPGMIKVDRESRVAPPMCSVSGTTYLEGRAGSLASTSSSSGVKYASMKTAPGRSQNHGIDLYLDQHLWVHKPSFANHNHGSCNGTWICIVPTVPGPKDLLQLFTNRLRVFVSLSAASSSVQALFCVASVKDLNSRPQTFGPDRHRSSSLPWLPQRKCTR
jgi:hypothetical protein